MDEGVEGREEEDIYTDKQTSRQADKQARKQHHHPYSNPVSKSGSTLAVGVGHARRVLLQERVDRLRCVVMWRGSKGG